jgi:hypothetical protein
MLVRQYAGRIDHEAGDAALIVKNVAQPASVAQLQSSRNINGISLRRCVGDLTFRNSLAV